MKPQIKLGFTLLELLVVIGIIAVLTAIGTVSYSTAQKKGRDSRAKADIKEIQNALETYFSIQNEYPASLDDLDAYFASGAVPTDPKTGTAYNFSVTADFDGYCICTHALETSSETTPTGNASTPGAVGICTFAEGDYFCLTNMQ